MNSIANLKTLDLQSADGPAVGIVMGLNIPDLETADEFIKEAGEKFKLQRMISPPTTSVLVISLMTPMPAQVFAAKWRALATTDKILGFFMSQMRTVDVARGAADGRVLETISLVDIAT